jgi:hypothetical protein
VHRTLVGITIGVAVLGAAFRPTPAEAQGAKPLRRCPLDSVVSGTVCMDTYEASVWRVPNATTVNRSLVDRIRRGRATAADLAAGGATQLGASVTDDYSPCADSGQNCTNDILARASGGGRHA